MRRTIVTLTAVTALVGLGSGALAGCGSATGGDGDRSGPRAGSGGDAVRVVASSDVYGDLVEHIGGDRVQVMSVIDDPSVDPHSYEASGRTQLAIAKADVVVENGGGYDEFMDRLLSSSDSDATVVNAVKTSGRKAVDGELNEHVWYDLDGVRKIVARLVTVLSDKSSGDAKTFAAHGTKLDAGIARLQATEAKIRAKGEGKSVAITEPVPLYLLQACGLTNRTPQEFSEAIEEGDDVPIAIVDKTLDLFRKRQVQLLAYNTQTTGAVTERVMSTAKSNDVPVVGFTETLPKGQTYLSWMRGNLDRIGAALA